MIIVSGRHNTAICYTPELEEQSEMQIRTVCDQPAFADSKIRIMPDVHAGMGCTIGTTMTITDKIVPGMVGVDIGCGIETVQLDRDHLDFRQLDRSIRSHIPSAFDVRKTPHEYADRIDLYTLRCADQVNLARGYRSIGTLGGGNHFIEVDRDESDRLYLVVHSGSRNLGLQVAQHYQAQAQMTAGSGMPKDLAYVEGDLFDDYIHDMIIMQKFAVLNRQAMVDTLLEQMDVGVTDQFTTIHNYIDTDSMILRKGAVSAKDGEKLLIPINMRDGCLICIGRGNPDWNYSAPHGAGRIMSRRQAFRELDMEDYRKKMQGIYSTSVNEETLDEAPMAYKPLEEIVAQIGPTAKIINRIQPVYNFKAPEQRRRRRRK